MGFIRVFYNALPEEEYADLGSCDTAFRTKGMLGVLRGVRVAGEYACAVKGRADVTAGKPQACIRQPAVC